MSTDSGDALQPPAQDIWRLPEILGVTVRHRRYPKLRRLTVEGVDRYLKEGTEVVVRLSEPLPIRALGPVLWIGDTPLTIAETDDEVEYRFLVTNPEALRRGDEVALAWNTPSAPRGKSRFRYEVAAGSGREDESPGEPVGS